MSWLSPIPAIIAACIAVPALVILYFLKLRRRDVEVSTTLLWKKAIQDLQANAPFQRLRRNILLLLQLIILAAALVAIAQPQWNAAASPGSKIVLLIDRSASMATKDESEPDAKPGAGPVLSRLDRARLDALRAIDSLRAPSLFGVSEPDQAMVIAFDTIAEVVQPFTADKVRLRAAIESIEPTDALTNLDEAMRLAGAYAKPVQVENRGLVVQPGPPVELFSDGMIRDAGRLVLPPETRITYHALGRAETPNYAITAMRAERSYDEPGLVSIFVGLLSTDPAPRSIDVELAIDGVASAARAVEMPAATDAGPGTSGIVFKLNRTQGASISVRIAADDALASDNTGRIALAPAKRVAVALVGEGDLFIASALESLPLSKLDRLTPRAYESLIAAGKGGDYDIYVMSGWAPAAGKEKPALPPGRFLIFGAIPPIEGLTALPAPEESKADVIIDWDRRHPSLAQVDLSSLILSRPLTMRAGESVRVMAQASRGPAIVEVNAGGARAIVAAFDPMETNWPFDVNFIVFLAMSIRDLAGDSGTSAVASLLPGETLSTRVPAGATGVTLLGPESLRVSLPPAADGTVSYGPLRRAGEYTLRWDGPAGATDMVIGGSPQRTIPVNLFDPHESAIDSRTVLALPTGDVQAVNRDEARPGASARDRRATRPLWPWLILAALAVLMLEWFIYHRKVRI